ncbi:GP63-like [Trichomonas vaginalis G3]|uniref:GP63-like n=1 Tax=Trichomonas vaginalis (strain ATCC PRA-98 / G3) TaxID=412133 RepID=A2FLZ3_TRIV3|nr:regulation of choline O-acetyltransferase protein [Trichomonas vaginalis G3]EAX94082.1 GP63-like [Trichomonas vaginalis G3]KAI5488072.1 regulation of choline O-acetyltransferase protein [Trichomonas vaginalis G3]|eukprot:XP_001307012.1 GP63-like [Trichomonas vaginalis G3]
MNNTVSYHPDLVGQKEALEADSTRLPIRVSINYSQIEDKSDSYMCLKKGQTISWRMGTVTCSDTDLMTQTKLDVLKQAFSQLSQTLSSLLNVTRLTKPITISSFADITVDTYSILTDLHITAVVRPFGTDSTLASAFSWTLNPKDNRPIQGGIYINPTCIPSTLTHEFFMTILHETCHVLGISQNFYEKWKNPQTGLVYPSGPVQSYYLPGIPNKLFYVEIGPYAQEFAKQQFGVVTSKQIPTGIILEDQGGSGTSMSHPKELYYLTDLMDGYQVPPSRLSNVTLSLLMDSGFYDVNFSMAEPLPYGNGISINGSLLTNFTTRPPQEVLPSHYFCEITDSSVCTFDFLAGAKCPTPYRLNCSQSNSICKIKEFIDPFGKEIVSNLDMFDYQMSAIPFANMQCMDHSLNANYAKLGMSFSNNSMCAMSSLYPGPLPGDKIPGCFRMDCDESKKLYIHVDKQNKQCKSKGQKIGFVGYSGSIICPDPEMVCNMRDFLGYERSDPGKSTYNIRDYSWLSIMIGCIVAVVCLISFTIYIFVRRRLRRRQIMHALSENQTTRLIPEETYNV